MKKKRRIEITAFRRRTTVYSNEKHPTEKHTTEPGADRSAPVCRPLGVVDVTGPNTQPGRKDSVESASFRDETPDNNNDGQLIPSDVARSTELVLLLLDSQGKN